MFCYGYTCNTCRAGRKTSLKHRHSTRGLKCQGVLCPCTTFLAACAKTVSWFCATRLVYVMLLARSPPTCLVYNSLKLTSGPTDVLSSGYHLCCFTRIRVQLSFTNQLAQSLTAASFISLITVLSPLTLLVSPRGRSFQ